MKVIKSGLDPIQKLPTLTLAGPAISAPLPVNLSSSLPAGLGMTVKTSCPPPITMFGTQTISQV